MTQATDRDRRDETKGNETGQGPQHPALRGRDQRHPVRAPRRGGHLRAARRPGATRVTTRRRCSPSPTATPTRPTAAAARSSPASRCGSRRRARASMSGSRLVRNSPDLARLVDEGYSIRVLNGYLVVDDIPFVNAAATVRRGSFLCPLDLARRPHRQAEQPRHVLRRRRAARQERTADRRARQPRRRAVGGLARPGRGLRLLPEAPARRYDDFYEKVTYYAAMVVGPAQARGPRTSRR